MSYTQINIAPLNIDPKIDIVSDKKDNWRWSVLRHNGVVFPPDHVPLPKNIKVLYNNVPVELDSKNTDNQFNVCAEEAAIFFAMKLEQDSRLAEKNAKRHGIMDDNVFLSNFWNDWKKILGSSHKIQDLKKVNFTPLIKYLTSRSIEKKLVVKNKTKEEKQETKEEKKEVKDLYGFAIVDGVKIALGSMMVQPPGLFIGHGDAPRKGKIKKRISPSDITLNISKKYVPKCKYNGKDCKWGNVVENHEVTWLATYKNPITNSPVYIWLSRNESLWVKSDDLQKFEKAKSLHKNISKIRQEYKKDLDSENKMKRQLATAVYLLDVLAIRPGIEKDEEKEANTLGLTTLKCENVEFKSGNNVKFKFAGKSSIEFDKTFRVDESVYRNLKDSCRDKQTNALFPNVNATTLNDYLKSLLPSLTAKVFRTWKASSLLQQELGKTKVQELDPVFEKKIAYDIANVEVAKALNHKNMTTGDEKVEKLEQKLREAKEKEATQKKIRELESKLEQAKENISTSTSKQNYIDPRISVAWCKKNSMPIEKIFNKSQLEKFKWAMTEQTNFVF